MTIYIPKKKIDSIDDLEIVKVRPPSNLERDWTPQHAHWGKWHVVSYDMTDLGTVRFVWRRLIKKRSED